jgi:hypothetical protein
VIVLKDSDYKCADVAPIKRPTNESISEMILSEMILSEMILSETILSEMTLSEGEQRI